MWRTEQISISATPVLLISITPNVKEGILKNTGSNTVYIREKNVDVTTEGFAILAGEALDFLYLSGEVYAACVSGETSTIALVIVEE